MPFCGMPANCEVASRWPARPPLADWAADVRLEAESLLPPLELATIAITTTTAAAARTRQQAHDPAAARGLRVGARLRVLARGARLRLAFVVAGLRGRTHALDDGAYCPGAMESVWDYPRPPRLERSTRRVRVASAA